MELIDVYYKIYMFISFVGINDKFENICSVKEIIKCVSVFLKGINKIFRN